MARALPFAVNTYSYTASHPAIDCLRHLAGQGYSAFELMMVPDHLWPGSAEAHERRALRTFALQHGLRIVSLNMPNIDLNIAALAPEMRRHSLDILHAILDLAGDLEVAGVVIGPGKANPLMPHPREQLTGHFFRALDALAPHAERAGTQLWVENMPFAFLPEADALMAALERYGDPRIAVVYDVANAVFLGEDPAAGLRRVRARLKLVHLSDTPTEVYRHAAVGDGVVPFAAIAPLLDEVGYGELPMLEIVAEEPDAALRRSVRRLIELGWPAQHANGRT